jgi:hypothetical protein
MNKLRKLVSVICNVAGVVALSLQGLTWWHNRAPSLMLFAPYYFTGSAPDTGRRTLNVLVRISNSSNADAFIYPETILAEVHHDGKWYRMQVLYSKAEGLQTDMPEGAVVSWGIDDWKPLKKFEDVVIARSHPLTRTITLSYDSPDIAKGAAILNNVTAIKLSFRDCHMKQFTLMVDFKKQREKYDPELK